MKTGLSQAALLDVLRTVTGMLKKVSWRGRSQTQRPPTRGGLSVHSLPLSLGAMTERLPVLEGSERTLLEEWGTHRGFVEKESGN